MVAFVQMPSRSGWPFAVRGATQLESDRDGLAAEVVCPAAGGEKSSMPARLRPPTDARNETHRAFIGSLLELDEHADPHEARVEDAGHPPQVRSEDVRL